MQPGQGLEQGAGCPQAMAWREDPLDTETGVSTVLPRLLLFAFLSLWFFPVCNKQQQSVGRRSSSTCRPLQPPRLLGRQRPLEPSGSIVACIMAPLRSWRLSPPGLAHRSRAGSTHEPRALLTLLTPRAQARGHV